MKKEELKNQLQKKIKKNNIKHIILEGANKQELMYIAYRLREYSE